MGWTGKVLFEGQIFDKLPIKAQIIQTSYSVNGRVALVMNAWDGDYYEPYANLTVNIKDAELADDQIILDEPKFPNAYELLVAKNIIEPGVTGYAISGFNTYPIVKFKKENHVKK